MRTHVAIVSVIVACVVAVSGCGSVQTRKQVVKVEHELQSLLDGFVTTHHEVPGAALHVEMPRHDLSWSGAAGLADRARKVLLSPQHPVRIASITKTFVAAGILRLLEQGSLDLDSSVLRYLPKEYVDMMRRGGYEPESITVRHLLTHTSGLFDFSQSDQFSKLCEADPTRRWTRAEQLQGAMDWGRPYGAPGKVFSYSDTGYILLGEILEQQTGKHMGEALRSLIGYKALNLASTWLETLEPRPSGVSDRAHQYEGDFDTYDIDPSCDLYGGGGLVSTPGDLARFMRGIFTGQVYARQATLGTMLSTVAGTSAGPPAYGLAQIPGVYRMGVSVREIEGLTVYSHSGYWGTLAAYVPSLDLAIGVTVNQQQSRHDNLDLILRHVLELARSRFGELKTNVQLGDQKEEKTRNGI